MDLLNGQSQQTQQDTLDQESVVATQANDDTLRKIPVNEGKEATVLPLRAIGTTIVGLEVPSAKAVVVASDGRASTRLADIVSRENEEDKRAGVEYFVNTTKYQKVLALSGNFVASFSGYIDLVKPAMENWPDKMGDFAQGEIDDSLRKTILDGLHDHLLECFRQCAIKRGEKSYLNIKKEEEFDHCFCAIIGSICNGVLQLCRINYSGHKPVEEIYSIAGSGEKAARLEMKKFNKEMTLAQAVEIAARALYTSGRFDRLTGDNFYAISLANGSVTKYTASFNQLNEYFGSPIPVDDHVDPRVETLYLREKNEREIAEFVETCRQAGTTMK
ncbi:hypothetical protein LINGRAHAP2_LOCUS17128 [Linum grandiflorum]